MSDRHIETIMKVSEATKAFSEIIKAYFQPSATKQALIEGERRFIENIVSNNLDNPQLPYFLAGYEQFVKEVKKRKILAG